jgi:hypothetical protein
MHQIGPSPVFFEQRPWPHVDLQSFRFLKQWRVRVGKESSFIVAGYLLQSLSEVQDLPLPTLHFAAGIEVENLHGSFTALNVEKSNPARRQRQDGGPTGAA